MSAMKLAVAALNAPSRPAAREAELVVLHVTYFPRIPLQ